MLLSLFHVPDTSQFAKRIDFKLVIHTRAVAPLSGHLKDLQFVNFYLFQREYFR